MKLKCFSILCSIAFVASTHAEEFTRKSSFESVSAFVAAAKALRPSESKTDPARLFCVEEPEYEDTTPVPPESLDSCEAVWEGTAQALVFAVAKPKTETHTAVGLLLLLSRSNHRWIITDLHRFTAAGKYAGITYEQTAESDMSKLDGEFKRPIVTVREFTK